MNVEVEVEAGVDIAETGRVDRKSGTEFPSSNLLSLRQCLTEKTSLAMLI